MHIKNKKTTGARSQETDEVFQKEKLLCPVCGADVKMDFKQVKSLFRLWNHEEDKQVNIGQKVLLGRLIKKFGYTAVREAFIQASIDAARMTLPYVRGILLKKAEAKAKAEEILEAQKLKAGTRAIAKELEDRY